MIPYLIVAALAAQAFTSFSGTFVDPQGAVLPGVRASLSDHARQTKYEVVSNREGQFEFSGVTPGEYQFDAALAGFVALHSTVRLTSQPASRTMTMEIGHLQETVTIVEPEGADVPSVSSGQAVAP